MRALTVRNNLGSYVAQWFSFNATTDIPPGEGYRVSTPLLTEFPTPTSPSLINLHGFCGRKAQCFLTESVNLRAPRPCDRLRISELVHRVLFYVLLQHSTERNAGVIHGPLRPEGYLGELVF